MKKPLPISADLLEMLRDPLAVQYPERYGPDPGRLELVHNCWLVSKDTGLKYPIQQGVPVMLIEEGMKWKDLAIDELPVPANVIPPALFAAMLAQGNNNKTSAAKIPSPQKTVSADLLETLRDPLAVQHPEKYGPDAGRLELVHNCWLVSKDTGLKYPIKQGIPVMLIEEGIKWKDVAVEDLPVPPPPLIPQ